jgi:hypothetical protein
MLKKIAFLIVLCSSVAIPLLRFNYNAYDLFHPLWNYGPVSSGIRTGAGTPSASYWQNSVDYKISASLDEAARKISGEVK